MPQSKEPPSRFFLNGRVSNRPSEIREVLDELRTALGRLARSLSQHGFTPGQVNRMIWRTYLPAVVSTDRLEVELALRQIFGGLIPPVTILPVSREELNGDQVRIEADVEPEPTKLPVTDNLVHGFTPAELAVQYSPRAAVSDHQDYFERWALEGAHALQGSDVLRDIAYGPSALETFDLFLPRQAASPQAPRLAIFFHGGYWQAMDKAEHCQFVEPFLASGCVAAVVNYGLCPTVTLAEIVAQAERAVLEIMKLSETHNYSCDKIAIIGHSAGAHIAAMMVGKDWSAPGANLPRATFGAAILVSGLYDLYPLRHLPPLARVLSLTDERIAQELSPIHCRPQPKTRCLLLAGALESAAFRWQTEAHFACWQKHLHSIHCSIVPGANHFSIMDRFREQAFGDCLAAIVNGAALRSIDACVKSA